MAKSIIIMLLFLMPVASKAQSEQRAFTYGEFKTGYSITQFGAGLSERYEAGDFSTSGGILSSIAVYRKFEKVSFLHFGLKFKGLAAMPAKGNNGEEMFFNFWGSALSVKYFPFQKQADRGLFLLSDFNFVSQFTQKYRNSANLEFDHQFAIGNSFALGVGYHYPLNNRYGIVATVEYDWASRTGEVAGLGDKNFRNSNIAFQVGFVF